MPNRSSTVGPTSTAITTPARCDDARLEVSRARVRRPEPGDRELPAPFGRRDDQHRVLIEVDLLEQAAEQFVGIAQRGRAQRRELLVGREAHVPAQAREIGSLDEHRAGVVARVPCRVECVDDAVGVELHAERRRGIRCQQHRTDLPVLDDTAAVEERQRRFPVAIVGTGTFDPVRVRDHCPADVVQRELVGDRADLDVVGKRVVLPLQGRESERHDAALGVTSGTAFEDLARGDVADDLVGVELIPVDAGQPDAAGARAVRHVRVGRPRSVGDHPRRRETRHRRFLEEPLDVG